MKKKTYTIEVINNKEGSRLIRTNDGFSAIELLGVLELIQREVIQQVHGDFEPDFIERRVVKD